MVLKKADSIRKNAVESILAKYKEHVEQTSQQPATAPETLDVRHEGVGSSVADPSFSMGKSPPQNGIYAFDKTSGAGGLGEGTPKGKGDGLTIERSGLHDNWDDAEGYYSKYPKRSGNSNGEGVTPPINNSNEPNFQCSSAAPDLNDCTLGKLDGAVNCRGQAYTSFQSCCSCNWKQDGCSWW
ncbi:hypothetical protein LOK49_LG01G02502 [Camellia lanceoleosa]|uniref:Uncharacterized protein n=1 Tax=Camellia lanceoleosa TaxID=1840588 RepID=A0ACC0J604_9ERIC|nr:hypothetical protein LOK49_LG01G02502 [Camellia lanceoleosa]